MTLTKMQAMLGVATGSLIVIGAIVDNKLTDERRFAALDTRLGKLESAIRTMNVTTPDERYKELIKELMASSCTMGPDYIRCDSAPLKDGGTGWDTFPATAGAAADAPAVKVPQ